MKTRIVAVVHMKGGVGKTTVSMLLAAELQNLGHRVLVADCDFQGSASSWASAAPENGLFPATVVSLAGHREKVHRELQRHLPNYEFIIVDTPPSLEGISSSALLVADLAIVPLPPSPADVWSACAIIALITRAQQVNTSLKGAILPNKVTRTSLSNAALRELDNFELPVMKTRMSSRVAYQEAVLAGSPVSKLGRAATAATAEVRSLADEVLELLGEVQ